MTTSLVSPRRDFQINLAGTLNLLEALRRKNPEAGLLFTSTNKVYGSLADIELMELENRYAPASIPIRRFGIGEDRTLDFHSPYGCSKGGADQYILDYGRIYSLKTAVFRMSCIYGPHQYGTEDQGWAGR